MTMRDCLSGNARTFINCGTGVSPVAALLISTPLLLLLFGCNPGAVAKAPARIETPDVRYAREAEHIESDPLAYLRQLHTRCDALEQYRLVFYRQQRQGLFGSMSDFEAMRATYRKEPFSVKFEWDDPKARLYESVYVAGHNNDKLILRERHGLPLFPPQVRILDPADPIKWGLAKEPITDFGLDQLLRRTLRPFEDPQIARQMTITYQGLVTLQPTGRPAHQIRIAHPPVKGLKYTRQHFYIDAETLLPAGTDLSPASGEVAARFRYADIETDVTLTDADFRLSKNHPPAQPSTINDE